MVYDLENANRNVGDITFSEI